MIDENDSHFAGFENKKQTKTTTKQQELKKQLFVVEPETAVWIWGMILVSNPKQAE